MRHFSLISGKLAKGDFCPPFNPKSTKVQFGTEARFQDSLIQHVLRRQNLAAIKKGKREKMTAHLYYFTVVENDSREDQWALKLFVDGLPPVKRRIHGFPKIQPELLIAIAVSDEELVEYARTTIAYQWNGQIERLARGVVRPPAGLFPKPDESATEKMQVMISTRLMSLVDGPLDKAIQQREQILKGVEITYYE